MDLKRVEITIDGPSSSGKSSVAKVVSMKLGIKHVSSGLFYRYLAFKVNELSVSNIAEIRDIASSVSVDEVMQHNESILHSEKISKHASLISSDPDIRKTIVSLQRSSVRGESFVMDGRDVGSVIFPKARCKFYLDASIEKRASRRYLQKRVEVPNISYDDIRISIELRDLNDSNRKHSPLVIPEGALVINGNELNIEEIKNIIVDRVHKEYYN